MQITDGAGDEHKSKQAKNGQTAPTVTDKITDWQNGKSEKSPLWTKQITAETIATLTRSEESAK